MLPGQQTCIVWTVYCFLFMNVFLVSCFSYAVIVISSVMSWETDYATVLSSILPNQIEKWFLLSLYYYLLCGLMIAWWRFAFGIIEWKERLKL